MILDDVYTISINSLVFSKTPKTVKQLEDVLNSNGYYGRFRIDRQYVKNSQDIYVKVKVYLPDSCCFYSWPLFGNYNLTSKCFTKRKKPSVLNNQFKLKKCLQFFAINKYKINTSIEEVADIASKYFGWATKSDYVKIMKLLIESDLIINGKFIIKSEKDIPEVFDNLLDANYF